MISTNALARFPARCILGFFLIFALGFLTGCSADSGGAIPITTKSDVARDHFLEGRALLDNLLNSEANREFERAVRDDPEFALAYLYLANSSNTARGFFENIRQAKALSGKASKGEQLMIEAAHAAANGDQVAQLEFLRKLVDAYPGDRHARMGLASFYFQQQELDSAIAHYEQLASTWPDFAAPYNMLGYSYRSKNYFSLAAKAFEKYISLIPDDPNPYDSYAELLLRTGEFEGAIEQYRKALELKPTFAPSRLGIAACLNMLERHPEAREELQFLFETSEDSGQRRAALTGIGISFVDESDLTSAIRIFEDRFVFDSTAADPAAMSGTLGTIAFLQVESNQIDEAQANYARAMEIIEAADLFERVKANARQDQQLQQGMVLLALNRLDEASRVAEEYYTQVESLGNIFRVRNAHLLLGRIAVAAGDYDKARSELLRTDTQSAWTLFHLGLAEEKAGNLNKAGEYFQRAAVTYELNSLAYALVRHEALRKVSEIAAKISS